MARWNYTIELFDEWQSAKVGKLTPQKLAQVVADKIKQLQSRFVNGTNDQILEALRCDFSTFASTAHDGTFDDFDVILERLYDWADIERVWINTLFPKKIDGGTEG